MCICIIKKCRTKAKRPLMLCDEHHKEFRKFFALEFDVSNLRLGDVANKCNQELLSKEQMKTRQLSDSLHAMIDCTVGA